MKSNQTKFTEEVVTGFRANRGKGSIYCFHPIDYSDIIYEILYRIKEKNSAYNILIVVDSYNTRVKVLDKLKAKDCYNATIKVLSKDYIKTNYNYTQQVTFTVGVNDDFELIKFITNGSIFNLCILTENNMNNNFISNVRSILPPIKTTVNERAVRNDLIYLPVEEVRRGVTLSDDDKEKYDKCTEFISKSISIFGSIDEIDRCKVGDTDLNISASEVRYNLAISNGWSDTLNTNIEFNRQIDEIYNPNALHDRAINFFNIIRERKDLLTDNDAKLPVIAEICEANFGKKILIVSKRGEFAARITRYINDHTDLECGDYHDNIEPCIAVDNEGRVITVKSGVNKGEPKMLGAQALSTLNLSRLNNSEINCLSIKNSSNVKLKTAIDVVIFTSSFLDDIVSLKTRFKDVVFNGVPNKTYRIYCIDTNEQTTLLNNKIPPIVTIIEENNNFVRYDKNTGDIIL